MIVIGVDPHKRTHTVCAVDAATGELRSSETVAARESGHGQLVAWARELGAERVWAVEDCRHVSGALERFLVAGGERVVRVAPKLMAGVRRSVRQRGKSDSIDALAVARAALREGIDRLPAAHLDEQALELKLLTDHRDDLVADEQTANAGCAGTSTTSGPTTRSQLGRLTAPSGSTRPPAASPAPSKPPESASPETSSTKSAKACAANATSKKKSPHWSPPKPHNYSTSQAAAH